MRGKMGMGMGMETETETEMRRILATQNAVEKPEVWRRLLPPDSLAQSWCIRAKRESGNGNENENGNASHPCGAKCC
jgi:hypothetical protein